MDDVKAMTPVSHISPKKPFKRQLGGGSTCTQRLVRSIYSIVTEQARVLHISIVTELAGEEFRYPKRGGQWL